MWFRNLRFYRFSDEFALPDDFENKLGEHLFRPCGRQEQSTFGWFSPFGADHETLTHVLNDCHLLCARREEKVLPAAVINAELEEKVRQIQEAEGRPVNRKEKQNLKEDLIHQLLPQAFSRYRLSWGYIDLKRQLVIINESAANKAEDFLGLLRSTLGSLPVQPVSPAEAAELTMTDWLKRNDLPAAFDFGDEAELRSPQQDGGILRCKNEDLTRDDIQAHIEAGKQVTRLGLVWQENIEFILETDFALKRVKATDILMDAQDDLVDPSPEEKLDADFMLVSAQIGELYDDLVRAFTSDAN
ncbi:recombination-associated protein RdgC [Idiomarina sp. OT37-5b]|uniref:Recombination-associated protein RdgC n=1 Tax=Idiomarina aquatica TaxID=1327752 RepID=A0AA94JD51_9GAMM|nr:MULTISPECIES: recombination-associated protein RdgC [Idiomarina]AVJ56771.1 recombination-associated protein RdgC [Idiomarina sp. OT37-5b]RUO42512.1 recombination-associated protein RdgC [Idiomarina aquatica]